MSPRSRADATRALAFREGQDKSCLLSSIFKFWKLGKSAPFLLSFCALVLNLFKIEQCTCALRLWVWVFNLLLGVVHVLRSILRGFKFKL